MIRSLTIQISSTSGVGPQGELEVVFSRWDQFDTPETQRPEFQYAVRVPALAGAHSDGTIAYGHDLRLGSGDGIDHEKAMCSLLTFLAADGEKYASAMRHGGGTSNDDLQHFSGESYLFNEETASWAYELSDELGYAKEELDQEHRHASMEAEALDAIARQMSGESWNADTVERIAAIVVLTGRKIEDVPEGPPSAPADDETERAYADRLLPAFRDFAAAASDHGELTVSEAINVLSDYASPSIARGCACEIGTRQRAQYGNVHSEDERR